MGLEQSRARELRPDVDKERKAIIESWQNPSHCDLAYSQDRDRTTLNVGTLQKAGLHLAAHFGERKLKILEVFAGNCKASQIVGAHLCVSSWLYTDIKEYSHNVGRQFNRLDTVQAVSLFGPRADILLMISPPYTSKLYEPVFDVKENHGYADYYACKDFIDQTESNKQIVFIGELGASDGSPGMYKYMLNHPRLKLVLRKLACLGVDCIGGSLEKEVFVFDVVQ